VRESDKSNSDTGDGGKGPGENWFQPPTAPATPFPGWPAPPESNYSQPPTAGGYPQPSGGPIAGAPPAGGPAAGPPAKPPRRWARRIGIIALIVVGLAAVGGGAGGLVWAHIRKPTPAQVKAAGQRAYAQQWRTLTAGQIFPATISYTSIAGDQRNATLVGIVPQAPCGGAFDASVARVLKTAGCVTVLRATYADASHTALVTVGVAVLPSTAVADSVSAKLELDQFHGLLPVSFPGTIASKFTLRARETLGEQDTAGRYLVFYAGGYADGRKTAADTNDGEITFGMPGDLVNSLIDTFSAPTNPCADREVRCTA
jgi:hypothetical protein